MASLRPSLWTLRYRRTAADLGKRKRRRRCVQHRQQRNNNSRAIGWTCKNTLSARSRGNTPASPVTRPPAPHTVRVSAPRTPPRAHFNRFTPAHAHRYSRPGLAAQLETLKTKAEATDYSGWSPELKRMLQTHLSRFRRSGAGLEEAKRDSLSSLRQRYACCMSLRTA